MGPSCRCWRQVEMVPRKNSSWSLVSSRPRVIFRSPHTSSISWSTSRIRWGASYNTIVAGMCFHSSSFSFRFFRLLGRKAPKKNGVLGRPEATSAVRQALSPGTGTTWIPAAMACWAISSPGSEIPGNPASVTKAMSLPFSRASSSTGPCFSLLCSW